MKLISIRKKLGLTQKAFSKKLNITQGAVSHWERGLNCPSPEIAMKIVLLAKKYGVVCTVKTLRVCNG